MKNFRLFAAIDPGTVEKQALACISHELRAQFKGGRVNTWGMYHITLHFFEEVPQDRVEDIKLILKKAAAKQEEFTLVTGGPGTFGPQDSAVVWIGLSQGTQELAALHAKLEKLLAKAGFLEENRPYTPHITLAREIDVTKLEPAIKDTLLADVNLHAGALTLLESKVVDGQAVYEPIASYPFKGK
jgi:2'-5' RNA ligase